MNVSIAHFIPVSETGISEDGQDQISESGNLTFGDANRTMFTPARILENVDFDDENDTNILNSIVDLSEKDYNGQLYIDLEN